ncbi:MAG TPA: hypothetical protein VHE59_06600 [Mucilaginibacter sp.]|nr:hypothetical protein [Mucilaginibacter sp.]
MKRFKKILRICALILFMLLAVTGMAVIGVAPPLKRDRKLFVDAEMLQTEHAGKDQNGPELKDEAVIR